LPAAASAIDVARTMRTTRVFVDHSLQAGADAELSREAAHHLVTVLRLKAGHHITLFNGRGGEFEAELTVASNKQAVARIICHHPDNRQSPLVTRLGISISRGERFEWVLQKATELGVSEIFPLYSERTEVRLKGEREDKKLARWQQVVISACEQCGLNLPPTLHPPQPLSQWLPIAADLKLVLHHRSSVNLASLESMSPGSVALLVGPEGGLAPEEIAQAQAHRFESLTLGPRVFRTETAPLAVLTLCQALWGDF
jgi:16S rRNA (uracil1498-N3)-methyltransferase